MIRIRQSKFKESLRYYTYYKEHGHQPHSQSLFPWREGENLYILKNKRKNRSMKCLSQDK